MLNSLCFLNYSNEFTLMCRAMFHLGSWDPPARPSVFFLFFIFFVLLYSFIVCLFQKCEKYCTHAKSCLTLYFSYSIQNGYSPETVHRFIFAPFSCSSPIHLFRVYIFKHYTSVCFFFFILSLLLLFLFSLWNFDGNKWIVYSNLIGIMRYLYGTVAFCSYGGGRIILNFICVRALL